MSDNENPASARLRFIDLLIFLAAGTACLLGAVAGLEAWLGADRLGRALPEDGATDDPMAALAILAATFAAMLPAIGLAIARHGRQGPALLGLDRTGGRWLWLLPIVVVAAAFALDDAILRLMRQILGDQADPSIVAMMQALATTPLLTLLAVLVVGLLAPVVEELIFRGLVYGYVEGRFGGIAALLVSTALFAAAHVEPAHMAAVLPTGLLLGWARLHTRSTWPAIAGHAANNTAATLAVYLFG